MMSIKLAERVAGTVSGSSCRTNKQIRVGNWLMRVV